MQPINMRRHWFRLSFTKPLEEATLNSKFGDPFFRFHGGRHLKKAIRLTDFLSARGIGTSDHDPLGSLLDDLEVIRDVSAGLVGR